MAVLQWTVSEPAYYACTDAVEEARAGRKLRLTMETCRSEPEYLGWEQGEKELNKEQT